MMNRPVHDNPHEDNKIQGRIYSKGGVIVGQRSYLMVEHGTLYCIDDLTLMSSTWFRQIWNWVVNGVHWAIMGLDLINAGNIYV